MTATTTSPSSPATSPTKTDETSWESFIFCSSSHYVSISLQIIACTPCRCRLDDRFAKELAPRRHECHYTLEAPRILSTATPPLNTAECFRPSRDHLEGASTCAYPLLGGD